MRVLLIEQAEELLATFNALLRIARIESGSSAAVCADVDLMMFQRFFTCRRQSLHPRERSRLEPRERKLSFPSAADTA